MLELVLEQVETAVRALTRAQRTSLGIEVTLPVTYPDGEMVTVVVSVEKGECVVHDAGAAFAFLAAAGLKLNRQMTQKAGELVRRYGCQFIFGRVVRSCLPEQAPLASIAVANASRSVADQATEVRRQVEQDFVLAVTEKLREIVGNRLRVNEAIKGKSGRAYRVNGVVLDEAQKDPIAFVAPIPNRNVVTAQFAEFYDLKQAYSSVINEAVYDEDRDLRDEDRRLLGMVSELVPFARSRMTFTRLISQ